MRSIRSLTLVVAATTLALTACGSSGGSSGGGGAKGLKMGGPAECPTRPFCEIGVKSTYNVKIASFKSLDTGGPLTVAAIKDGTVDFGLMFTSDPTVDAQGLVLLTDDKHLQNSDNVIPIVNTKFNKAPASTALNAVQGVLSQDALNGMNKAVQLQHVSPTVVANGFLAAVSMNTKAALCGGATGSGKVKVGAFNFAESGLLANVYAAALKICGYSPTVKSLGAREVVYPALKKGDLDIVPEYAATLTTFLKGTASSDITTTVTALTGELPSNLVALKPGAATDQNGFAVTKAFATAHNLTTMTDLGTYSQTAK